MPYKRPKRKNRRRKPRTHRPPYQRLETRVRKLERSNELKFTDTYSTTAPVSTGVLICPSLLAQGDDSTNRLGEEITNKYLNMMIRWIHPLGNVPEQLRVLVFWDMQVNGAGADLATSLATSVLDNSVVATLLLAPHNYRTKKRYKILHDKVYVIDPDSTGTDKIRFIRRNFNLHNARTKYNVGGSTINISTITTRALYIAHVTTTANTSTIAVGARLWFVDP